MAGSTGSFLFNLPCLSQPKGCFLSFHLSSSESIKRVGLLTRNRSRYRLYFSASFDSGRITSNAFQYGRKSGNRSSTTPHKEKNEDFSLLESLSVRLIGEDQSMIGIVPKNRALELAILAGLDLVVISKDADPPVVKMMSYKKYMYEQEKKKKEQQKKAVRMHLKELKMGYNIASHDYGVRLRAAQKFLKGGDRVKVAVRLKGRENEFKDLAIELLRRFQKDVGLLATEEVSNFRDSNIYVIMIPNKAATQKDPAVACR